MTLGRQCGGSGHAVKPPRGGKTLRGGRRGTPRPRRLLSSNRPYHSEWGLTRDCSHGAGSAQHR